MMGRKLTAGTHDDTPLIGHTWSEFVYRGPRVYRLAPNISHAITVDFSTVSVNHIHRANRLRGCDCGPAQNNDACGLEWAVISCIMTSSVRCLELSKILGAGCIVGVQLLLCCIPCGLLGSLQLQEPSRLQVVQLTLQRHLQASERYRWGWAATMHIFT